MKISKNFKDTRNVCNSTHDVPLQQKVQLQAWGSTFHLYLDKYLPTGTTPPIFTNVPSNNCMSQILLFL